MGGGGSKRKASETPAPSAKGSSASVKDPTLKKKGSKDKDLKKEESDKELLKRAEEMEAAKEAVKKKKEEPKQEKLFAKPEGPKRSKIYQALNPEKLYYESGREKAEAQDTKAKVVIRGGALGADVGAVDFAVERDAEGNIVEHAPVEEVEDDHFDPNDLPDFDPEEKAELEKRRKEREAAQKAKQDRLRAEYLKKKEAEDKKRAEEVKKIQEKEAKLKKGQVTEDPNFVAQAQKRLESETKDLFRDFSFKK